MKNFCASFYRSHLKKKLFNKIMLFYSAVIIVSLLALSIFVLLNLDRNAREKELSVNNQVLDSINSYYYQKYNMSQNIVKQLYANNEILSDLSNFLKLDFTDYSKNRLDSYLKTQSNTMVNFRNTINSFYYQDPDISNIILHSKAQNFYFVTSNEVTTSYTIYGRQAENLSAGIFGGKRQIFQSFSKGLKLPDRSGSNYSIMDEIIGSDSHDIIGEMIINFSTKGIYRMYQKFQKDMKGYILVLTNNGDVLYDSSDRFYGTVYPYMDRLKSSTRLRLLDEKAYVNVKEAPAYGIIIAGILPERQIAGSTKLLRRTIFAVAGLLVAGSILLAYFIISIFSKRTKNIMEAMEELQKGNLSVRIPLVDNGDELSLIASGFNNMCMNLDGYIRKVYLAEIKQKNSQLIALQSQINPHFLCNTLEVIRMRAVSKGADDVGEMIYILATLFRNTVKKDTIISIMDEINQCRLYLQLFCIRYKDIFSYDIEVQNEILNCGIPKFTLQPVIENYIVHGIVPGIPDNRITIEGRRSGSNIVFCISDNGTGIDSEKFAKLKGALNEPENNNSSTIGLVNVNERLRIIYGDKYGLDLDSVPGKGTSVYITIPALRKEEVAGNVEGLYSR